jgi:hypothetical protein
MNPRRIEVAAAVERAARRDLPERGVLDFEWARALLAPSGLPDGLVALLALEAAFGPGDTITPCCHAWLGLLGAAVGDDPYAYALREALALATDARQCIRESRWDPSGVSTPDPAEAVQAIFSEAKLAAQYADLLADHRTILPVAGR